VFQFVLHIASAGSKCNQRLYGNNWFRPRHSCSYWTDGRQTHEQECHCIFSVWNKCCQGLGICS